MKLSNKVYDMLKWLALVVLPALSALYLGLSGLWGFPYGEQVSGTIALVDTFLGAVLGISSANYAKNSGR